MEPQPKRRVPQDYPDMHRQGQPQDAMRRGMPPGMPAGTAHVNGHVGAGPQARMPPMVGDQHVQMQAAADDSEPPRDRNEEWNGLVSMMTVVHAMVDKIYQAACMLRETEQQDRTQWQAHCLRLREELETMAAQPQQQPTAAPQPVVQQPPPPTAQQQPPVAQAPARMPPSAEHEDAHQRRQYPQQQPPPQTVVDISASHKASAPSDVPRQVGHPGGMSAPMVAHGAPPPPAQSHAAPATQPHVATVEPTQRGGATTGAPTGLPDQAGAGTTTGNEEDEACWNCGREATETCSRCKKARYCGVWCQRRDWKMKHHRVCREPNGDEPAENGAASHANGNGNGNGKDAPSSQAQQAQPAAADEPGDGTGAHGAAAPAGGDASIVYVQESNSS